MDTRTVLFGGACLVLGAAVSALMTSGPDAERRGRLERVERQVAQPLGARPPGFGEARRAGGDDGLRTELERRIRTLEETVARETAERQRLEDELENMAAQLAGRGGGASAEVAMAGGGGSAGADGTTDEAVGGDAGRGGASAPDPAPAAPPQAQLVDWSLSAMERALVAAGVDRSRAVDIKRRDDELAMAEITLRDQATREEWIDTPRFNEQLAEINNQRTSMRDEIGDEAFDRYLYAQGQTNRVRIDDVMTESPAALAGLQTHDMILRYGDTRIFLPEDLVGETQSGTAGEMVRLEVIRNGERIHIDVPRGPLGVRIAPTQDSPTT